MSNARIQFSLASEEVWNAYNPLLKEGEIVTVLKANKKVKLVQGKVGGSTYSESTVIWDEDEAQIIMSRSEAAAVTATAQAAAAKNYSENVNVFLPSVSSEGVLEWTNKAGLTNPPAVNIKGATGAAATIEIGTVSTGAAGSNASVVNRGTANNAVFDFTLPRGADGGVTVDAALSDTSINPVQNKVINEEFKSLALSSGMLTIPSSQDAYISKLAGDALGILNDIVHLVVEQSADGVAWETLFDSEKTVDNDYRIAYLNGLLFPTMLEVTRGCTARITCTVQLSATYLSGISIFLVSLKDNSSNSNYYKCYYGYDAIPSVVKAEGEIGTYGSWSTALFKNLSYNTVQYVFNEERDASAQLAFGGVLCKGTVAYRNTLNFDMNRLRTSTSFPVKAPNFIGKVNGFDVKASVPANAKFIDNETPNTWTGRQTFNEAHIVKEVYQSEYINGTTITPTRSTMRLVTTGATTLDMTNIVAECLGNNKTSTVFTAYITSNADYTLTITNAGSIKYSGSASDVAITSAGLLLNILMLKDASGNVTSIVQASKLEGGA